MIPMKSGEGFLPAAEGGNRCLRLKNVIVIAAYRYQFEIISCDLVRVFAWHRSDSNLDLFICHSFDGSQLCLLQ